jgi:flagellar biosynthesis protein FlhB
MTPELEKCLTEITQGVLNSVDKIKSFSEYQLPEYISQLMTWHVMKSFFSLTISFMFLFITFILIKKTFKLAGCTDEKGEHSESTIIKMIIYVVLAIVTIVIACANFDLTWLKIWIAPKVWLIDYATGLLN